MARVPAYCHHKSSDQAYVRIDGRQVYLGRHGSEASKAAYKREIDRWRLRSSQHASLSVSQLVILFDDHAREYYQKGESQTKEFFNLRVAFRPLLKRYGRTLACEFGPLKLKRCRQDHVEQQLSRGTCNRYMRHTVRLFRWAVAEELVPAAVLTALAAVPGLKQGRSKAPESKPVLPVAEADVEAVLPYVSRQVAAMARLQMLTAARPGEVVQIRPCDVDRSGDVWLFTPESHKTEHHGRQRVVWIGPQAQDVLRPWLLRPDDRYCFSPAEAEKERLEEKHAARVTPISCGNRPGTNRRRTARKIGERYDTASYGAAVARGIRMANRDRKEQNLDPIPAWRPNRIRHTAATTIRQKYGLDAAQVILGHSTARVTEIYALGDHAKAARIMLEVG